MDAYIAALLAERRYLERRGEKDRVAQVDAELERLGFRRPNGHAAIERAVTPAPDRTKRR